MNLYDRLRPDTDIEYCDCSQITRILLVYTLSVNPIHCYECKGAIDPERISLSNKRTEKIASWHRVFSSLYDLWMDSGEYENFAKKSLLNKEGEVNTEAVKIAKDLSTEIPTYYWWWHDFDDGDFTECPNCNGVIDQDNKHGVGKCEKCCIVA